MRISTSQIFNQNLIAMQEQQAKLSETQLQISTGKKILNPSDDPAGSVQLLNLQREASLSTQYLENADKATNKLENEEATLASATDILQRIRELAVQGLNDTNTQSDRQAIAAEITQLNEQLFALANTRDSNGDYLFSGYASNTQPYGTLLGDYQGDEGQRNLKVGPGVLVPTNDSGASVFETKFIRTEVTSTPPGNENKLSITDTTNSPETFSDLTFTYVGANQFEVSDGTNVETFSYVDGKEVDLSQLNTAFPSLKIELTGTHAINDQFTITKQPDSTPQTLFRTVQGFADALVANEVGANDSPNNGDFLTNISSALTNIIDKRSEVGGRLNAIDQQKEINDTVNFNLQKSISEIKDLDYAEAISRLSQQSLSLQAAQQSFVKVQNLSLFNFL